MIDAARQAMRFINGRNPADLKIDAMLSLALVKCLETIGEAAIHLSNDCKGLLPTVPWQHIVGLRNRLVHDYSNINTDLLWQITKSDVPALVGQLERLLAQIESSRNK